MKVPEQTLLLHQAVEDIVNALDAFGLRKRCENFKMPIHPVDKVGGKVRG
jgi:hypothetical protein